MKNRFLALVLALSMSLCLMLAPAMAEGSKGIFYRVNGGKNEMVILGSIHIGSEAMYPMGDHITNALSAADTLVFECDTESAEAMAATMSAMFYPQGETLQDHISAECYAAVEALAERTSYPVAYLNSLKPWAVMSMFSMISTAAVMGVEDINASMALGVESTIVSLAGVKEQTWLETTREQLAVMDHFSPALQEYLLQSTCDMILDPSTISGSDADIKYWPEWWSKGDADAFATSYLEGEASDPKPELTAEYHDSLVTKRNGRMAQTLSELLEREEDHRYFVTIGLLHLVLPNDSVLSELEAMGYTVERILP